MNKPGHDPEIIVKERLVVSSDHAGFDLKMHLIPFIESLGYETEDVGTFDEKPVDYPIFTYRAARKIMDGECRRGIVFCGTGQGDAIAANKVPGIRAALCWDEFTARMSRAHNDANMLVLGGWVTGHRVAEGLVRVWLSTDFDGGRHVRRLDEICEIERDMRLARGKIYDVTREIKPGMLNWPGDAPVVFQKKSLEGVASLTSLSFSAHAGTHLDGPSHIIKDAGGVSGYDFQALAGLARVVCVPPCRIIDETLLESLPIEGSKRLLLKTTNSALLSSVSFAKGFVALSNGAAEYLVRMGIEFIAIDYLSVDVYESTTYPVHQVLLTAGVAVVEGVDLSQVPAGDYELICLPIKLEDCDGAPARVILRAL
jgi:ribose 5-phosphate isomerase B